MGFHLYQFVLAFLAFFAFIDSGLVSAAPRFSILSRHANITAVANFNQRVADPRLSLALPVVSAGITEDRGWCLPDEIELNEQNLKSSRVAEYYSNWRGAAMEYHLEEYLKYGEGALFARQTLGDPNFTCDLGNGCKRMPTCIDVANRLQIINRNPDRGLTDREMKSESKRLYLALKQIEAMNDYFANSYRLLSIIQPNTMGTIDSIVKGFTTQPSRYSEEACGLLKRVYSFAWFTFKTMSQSILDTESSVPKDNDAVKLIFYEGVKHGFGYLAEHFQRNQADESQLDAFVSSDTGLRMVQSYTGGVCDRIGGDMKIENEDRVTQMNLYVRNIFMDARKSLGDLWFKTFRGHLDSSNDTSVLAAYMSNTVFFDAARRTGHASPYERKLTQDFEDSLVSAAWASSKCYLKCAGNANSQDFCQNSKWDFKESRYCPSSTEVCQAQCWTTQKKGNHEKVLTGISSLGAHSLTLEDVLTSSYDNFMHNGNAFASPGAQIEDDPLWVDGAVIRGNERAMLTMPTCRSDLGVRITDFNNKIRYGGHKNQNQAFPVSCGDWKSNETREFLEALGYGARSQARTEGLAAELFEHVFVHGLDKIKEPLTRYLAFCEANLAFPQKGGGEGDRKPDGKREPLVDMHRVKMYRGRNPSCDEVKREVEGMKEGYANLYFCTESATGRRVMGRERSYTEGTMPFMKRHNHLCKAFTKKLGKEVNLGNIDW